MKRERYLRRRLQTLNTLHEAVSAMKSLSAHQFRRCRQGLTTARTYREEIDTAIAEAGVSQRTEPAAPPGLVLIASDLGLCGDYNSRLVEATLKERCHGAGPLYVIGRRPRAQLERAGVVPQRMYDAPTSVDGLSHLLLELAQHLLEDFAARAIGNLHVVSARFEGAGRFAPVVTPVLPIGLVPRAAPLRPTLYESYGHLAAVAVREFLYTTLHQLLLDALAAEHGMRLVAAESARQWLDETLDTVRRDLAAVRREASTQEVLDVAAGARAGRRNRGRRSGDHPVR